MVGAWQYLDRRAALAAAPDAAMRAAAGTAARHADAVKDLIDTADMPTGYGSPIYVRHRPAADAACVALARAAGAVVLGKTVTTEFAASPRQDGEPHESARIPRAARRAVPPPRSPPAWRRSPSAPRPPAR